MFTAEQINVLNALKTKWLADRWRPVNAFMPFVAPSSIHTMFEMFEKNHVSKISLKELEYFQDVFKARVEIGELTEDDRTKLNVIVERWKVDR